MEDTWLIANKHALTSTIGYAFVPGMVAKFHGFHALIADATYGKSHFRRPAASTLAYGIKEVLLAEATPSREASTCSP